MQAVGDDRTMYSEGVVDACGTRCVVKAVVEWEGVGAGAKVASKAVGLFGRILPTLSDRLEVFRTAYETIPETVSKVWRIGGATGIAAEPELREAIMRQIVKGVYPHAYQSQAEVIRELAAWIRIQQRAPYR